MIENLYDLPRNKYDAYPNGGFDDPLVEAYFNWLISKIAFGDNVNRYYDALLILYTRVFEWSVMMDKNREADGADLLLIFAQEEEINYEDLYRSFPDEGGVSVLSVLIALAQRISNDELGDRSKGDRTADWFWRMFHNLGLSRYSGDLSEEDFYEVIYILKKWMSRNFDYDGKGSPFPLLHPPGDERKVELLYQMRAYVRENFPV